ncbi:MAG: TIM barrel protein [Candidatus Thorarchaeota archaeon]|nr:TIM barrel protein [Candidatus Thorarchaeota archaeon]
MTPIANGNSHWRNDVLKDVLFGPAGYPPEARGNPKKVFEIIREAGLTALEYAAVRGLNTSEEKARLIGKYAAYNGITMSLHAAYYISLASTNMETRETSKQRLIKALKFAPWMGVKRIVFHAGTHGGLSDDESHSVIKNALQEVWEQAGYLGEGALLAPEIAGKIKAFGSVEELIRLCSELEGTIPTLDWAHLYARSQGEINDKDSYLKILQRFEDGLGSLFVKNMHFHISGIEYTKAGESKHQPLGSEWGPDILPLMEIVDEVGYKPTFISESTEPIRGALYAKYVLEELENSR